MKNKIAIIVCIVILIVVGVIVAIFKTQGNISDNNESMNSDKNEKFQMTNKVKAKLENYCYFIQEFDSNNATDASCFDSNYLNGFIVNSSKGFDYSDFETEVIESGEDVTMVKISKDEVANQFKLIYGLDMPLYEPEQNEQLTVYYEDGYYYVDVSEYGNTYYQYSSEETKDGIIKVTLKILVDDEPTDKIGLTIKEADNANGFVVISSKIGAE